MRNDTKVCIWFRNVVMKCTGEDLYVYMYMWHKESGQNKKLANKREVQVGVEFIGMYDGG